MQLKTTFELEIGTLLHRHYFIDTIHTHAGMTAGAVHSVATNNNWTIAWPLHSSTKYTWHHPCNGIFIASPCNLTMCRMHRGLITRYLIR